MNARLLTLSLSTLQRTTKDAELKQIFQQKLEALAQTPTSVLLDANARTGQRVVGCGDDESRLLGAYGREGLNDNGEPH